jgi:hypothetical protein
MPQHEGMNTAVGAQQDENGKPPGPLDEFRNGVKAFFDISVNLGNKIDENTKATKRYLNKLERNTPQAVRRVAQGTYTAGTFLLLDLGRPDAGTFWEVHSIIAGGVDVFTTAAGSAGMYVGALEPIGNNAAPGGMIDAVDVTSTLPNVSAWGTGQLKVLEQEYVFVIVAGAATAGQVYVANLRASAYPTDVAGGKTDVII